MPSRRAEATSGSRRLAGVAALTLLAGCLAGCGSAGESPAAPAGATRDRAASAPSSPAPSSATPGPAVPTFEVTADAGTAAPSQIEGHRPTALRLPSGSRVPIEVAVTGSSGLLRVPRDIRSAGWWDGSARIGDPYGAIVVAGHVDSTTQGLGPFAELLAVTEGDHVQVSAGPLRQTFEITQVDLVPKISLDVRSASFFGVSGPTRLVLITCAGEYDPARGGYQDLAVVTARPLGNPSMG